jgi:autoinducer 2 (AI-2) kinase
MIKGGISKEEIKGVSSTSQRYGALFLDKNGRELYAGPNIDTRGVFTQGIIEEALGDLVYEITGHAPYLVFIPARLLWFRENKPEIYERISHVLAINDWVLFKLSGAYATEPSTASESLLFDISKVMWSKKILNALEFHEGILPELSRAGEQIGEVTPESSMESGLEKGTQVIVGGPDVECGLLGSKVFEDGEVGGTLGSTAPIQMITSKPLIDPKKRIWSGCHVLPERWTIESNAQMAGLAYRWLRDKIVNYGEGNISYKEMDEMARNKPIGSGDTYASLGPEIMNIQKMQIVRPGLFLFPPPANPVVTPIDMGNLIRATLENICYAIRGNCDQLAGISGKSIKELKVSGGLATSKLFTQILADILDVPVVVPEIKEGTSFGCTICASVGTGFYNNLIEASKEMVTTEKISPIKPNVKVYRSHYRRWLSLYEQIPDLG